MVVFLALHETCKNFCGVFIQKGKKEKRGLKEYTHPEGLEVGRDGPRAEC